MIKTIHVAAALIENDKGEILVLLRQKGRLEEKTYGLPGGKVEPGETREEAVIREINEEIGITVEPENLEFLRTFEWDREINQKFFRIKFELFKLKSYFGADSIKLQPSEAVKCMWAKPERLYQRKNLMVGMYVILRTIYKLE